MLSKKSADIEICLRLVAEIDGNVRSLVCHVVQTIGQSMCFVLLNSYCYDYIWATSWQNQQNGMCAQRRLWSDSQSDQSLRCALSG